MPNSLQTKSSRRQRSVLVVGAGAFGGWSALQLLRRGAKVTLLDAWGPGNSRASSGGETRVIRATYGPKQIYTEMAMRSLALWKENQARWGTQLFHQTGVLWMVSKAGDYERAALPILNAAGVKHEQLTTAEVTKRWPPINPQGVQWAIFEPEAGYLMARRACQAVLEAFVREGGMYQQAEVTPGAVEQHAMSSLRVNGDKLSADAYVFACGPWLPKLFPVLAKLITPTRQEVFFFGPPAGKRFSDESLPVWIDHGERFMYGIPGNEWRGFKIADDTRGAAFDPSSGERRVSSEGLAAARKYLEMRFPEMRGAPLLEGRVCQYEDSRDQDFIIDRHPEAENTWLVGGGSGHGFKHGPAMGELVAEAVLHERAAPAQFSLKRFNVG